MPLILFNKPFQVLCQFSPSGDKETLAHYIKTPNVYPAGRLDYDSEGLMLMTDDGKLQHKIAHPDRKEANIYLAQVEGVPDAAAMARLQAPLDLLSISRRDGSSVASELRTCESQDPLRSLRDEHVLFAYHEQPNSRV